MTFSLADNRITVRGEIDRNTTVDFFKQSIDFKTHSHWQVDLADAERIDSAGLALLLYWREQAMANGSNLVLANVPEEFDQLMHIFNVKTLLDPIVDVI